MLLLSKDWRFVWWYMSSSVEEANSKHWHNNDNHTTAKHYYDSNTEECCFCGASERIIKEQHRRPMTSDSFPRYNNTLLRNSQIENHSIQSLASNTVIDIHQHHCGNPQVQKLILARFTNAVRTRVRWEFNLLRHNNCNATAYQLHALVQGCSTHATY